MPDSQEAVGHRSPLPAVPVAVPVQRNPIQQPLPQALQAQTLSSASPSRDGKLPSRQLVMVIVRAHHGLVSDAPAPGRFGATNPRAGFSGDHSGRSAGDPQHGVAEGAPLGVTFLNPTVFRYAAPSCASATIPGIGCPPTLGEGNA